MYDGVRMKGYRLADYMVTDFKQYEGLIGQRDIKPQGRDWEAISLWLILTDPRVKLNYNGGFHSWYVYRF